MCPAENPGCRDQPFTILYRDMDVVSGRSGPADIFQMQATTRYPGAYYIFQIKSGNEGREFYMRVRGGLSGGHHLPQGVLLSSLEYASRNRPECSLEGWVWRQEGKVDGSQGSTVLVPLTFCVALRKLLPLCEPQDPYLCNEKLGQDAMVGLFLPAILCIFLTIF